jgi:hypothetical protein
MKKALISFLCLAFWLSGGTSWAGTVYLYIEESCNGERGFFLTKAREGMFDALFTDGHIIFDDMSDKGTGTRLVNLDVAVPLAAARKGGADFLITLSIESTVRKLSDRPKSPEKIDSRCRYALFEVGTSRRLVEGELFLQNDGKEVELDRDRLGFELGREVAAAVEKRL